jgi:hypothetical protein
MLNLAWHWALVIILVVSLLALWFWYFSKRTFPCSLHDDTADSLDMILPGTEWVMDMNHFAKCFDESHTAMEQYSSIFEPFPEEVVRILGEYRNRLARAENTKIKRELHRACGWGRALRR